MAEITFVARTDAPRRAVWDVLTASDRWAEWGDFTDSVRVTEGEGHPDGVGAVRELWTAGLVPAREQVTTFDPDGGVYEYVMIAGPPLKDYRGHVELTDADGGGTMIEWTASFRPPLPIPGADLVLSKLFGVVVWRLTKGLARQADRLVRTT